MILIGVMVIIAAGLRAQFVPKPLNYPSNYHFMISMDAPDAQTLWVGTRYNPSSGYTGYSDAVETTNGGSTWVFSTIPATGIPRIDDVFAWNSLTAFYVITDNDQNGDIWKTSDGSNTWTLKTTGTQFNGGFAIFCHGFSADTGLAMGDPTQGYFELLVTNNGGDTWSRVPSANIPAASTCPNTLITLQAFKPGNGWCHIDGSLNDPLVQSAMLCPLPVFI